MTEWMVTFMMSPKSRPPDKFNLQKHGIEFGGPDSIQRGMIQSKVQGGI
jgi:hypothetical protein